MKNLKVSLKLIIGFAIAVALTVIVGIAGIFGMTSMSDAANNMYAKQATPLGDLLTATDYFQRLRVQVRNAIIYSGDAERLKTVENDMNDRISKFEGAMQAYEPSLASEKGRQLYNSISEQYNSAFKPGILNVLEGAKQGKSQAQLLEEMEVTTLAANQIAVDLSDIGQARLGVMKNADDANSQLGSILFVVIIGVIVAAATISIALALYISNLISKPLNVLTTIMSKAGTTGDITLTKEDAVTLDTFSKISDEVGQCIASTYKFVRHLYVIGKELEAVADGDLTVELKILSEKDTMGVSIQKMVGNLNEMFGEIHVSTTQVNTASKQVADGSQSLAQSSTEQAAIVEQLSSSVTEIAQKTKTNAEMADKAAKLARSIKDSAETGTRQMDEMMTAVKEINDASHNISRVIKVIDDIAFQTNILALNAAVEAARAGQHGKGFAVVAEEVRSLAAKSADAAKDTGKLITSSIEKAEFGSRIAGDTALSLAEIVSGINESSQLIGDIANSSEEQSDGISQINKGIDQVAQTIQQTSATAEESAAASEEMSGQAVMLEKLTAQFKLKSNNSGHSLNGSSATPQKYLTAFNQSLNLSGGE